MARIPPVYQEKIIFHLGYASYDGIPPQDVYALETAMNNVKSEVQVEYIIQLVDTLDNIFKLRDPTNPQSVTEVELYAGDINRSRTRREMGSAMRAWRSIYLTFTDELARALQVVNYQHDSEQGLRFQKGTAIYVTAVPGHQIPNVGSNLYLASRMA